MMMKFLLSLAITLISFSASAQSAADKVLGDYWSPNKDAKISIYKTGTTYAGKLSWVKVNRKDTKNPNASLRTRDLLNLEFMHGFKYNTSDEEWIDGKIYDAASGKTYSCKMWLSGANLKVRGYMGFSMLGRTEIFERIK